MSDLIVLTCASGKQCSQLIPLLYGNPGYKLRLAVNSTKSLDKLTGQYPNAEVVQANLGDANECSNLVNGATTVYYVGPPFHPHELEYGINMVDAAVKESRKPDTRFSHFIFSSVLHAELRKLLNHDCKRLIEEYLVESGLQYTILQPSHYADNAIMRLISQKESAEPVFAAAHDPSVAFSFSCVRDHAEVSAKVIQERERHFYATYPLASTMPMKYTEYIRSVGEVLNVTFQVKQIPYEEAVQMYCKIIFGSDEVDQAWRDGPERLLLYYNRRGIVGNPGILEWLLGRPGTTPAELAVSILADNAKNAST